MEGALCHGAEVSYVMLLKYDNAEILSFSRVYSFDQAQNHGDKMYLKRIKL